VHHIFINCNKAHDSVKKDALINILTEFGIPKANKMCLSETYVRLRVGKHLSDSLMFL